ncbi:MAG: ATP-binding protein [Eubacteriaceae bacterium]|nr:ATP-binding protein [Eubacteriaceae bacterium]
MKRAISNELTKWKSKPKRMPLLVYGARQVGKTYTIREFGNEHFNRIVYINLETDALANSWFDGSIEPSRIIKLLESHVKMKIDPKDTLIFLDEVQSCERALTSLKYFNENAPEYPIIAAGSLLGVSIKRENHSFPVGNVDSLTLYPFTFEEFLWSLDESLLLDEIRESFQKSTPIHASLHQKANELYKIFLIVGGMPASILEYLNYGSLASVPDVQNRIVNDYIADMAKYASDSEAVRIRQAFSSIPSQLAKDNKKFQYKVVRKGGSSRVFSEAIDWLEASKTVNKCYGLTTPEVPLNAYKDFSSFKLYMCDTGLLVMASQTPQSIILSDIGIDNRFMGAIAENYVAQHFAASGKSLLYWKSDSKSGGQAEIDFVLQEGASIIPVEVKAGEHTRSRSLSVFASRYKPPYSIRISSKNFGYENGIKSVPLYAVHNI